MITCYDLKFSIRFIETLLLEFLFGKMKELTADMVVEKSTQVPVFKK
jgi:hypothetical protein